MSKAGEQIIAHIPSDVCSVMGRLNEEGFRAYLVGGCVRDLLLGLIPVDWDVATDARPDAVAAMFDKSIPTGAKFGTITVMTQQRPVEVTTFRSEYGYEDQRHPAVVEYVDDIDADLLRRDVTINAMALSLAGEISDPANGQEDLNNRIIRSVGCPQERFGEDALRLLRVVRLAADKGFDIEPKTYAAICRHAQLVEKVSGERITVELDRMITGDRARLAVKLLAKTGLLSVLFADIDRDQADWQRAGELIERLSLVFPLRLAGLLVGVRDAIDIEQVCAVTHRLRIDGKTKNQISKLCDYVPKLESAVGASDYRLCRIAADLGRGLAIMLAELVDARAKLDEIDRDCFTDRYTRLFAQSVPLSTDELAIGGNHVMALTGLNSGPRIGIILQAALEQVWDDPRRNTESWLCQFVRSRRYRLGRRK